MLQQHRNDRLISIRRVSTRCVIALLFSVTIARVAPALPAQAVQTSDSEAQLASMLCRTPTEGATNELLLTKNAQLVNTRLWNALTTCAFAAQHQTPARAIEIHNLNLRVAERLTRPDLAATTHYYLGRTYRTMSDFENSIASYETSRNLFAQAGIVSNVSYVLADLGALYFAAEDWNKARSYAEQSLALAGQMASSPAQEAVGPIEYARARSLQTLGEIERRHGNYEEANQKLVKALAFYEQLNAQTPSYNIEMAEVLIVLAKVHGEMGKYARAFSYLNKAHQVSKSSRDQHTRANIISNRGSLFLEQEDYAAAQKSFNASLGIYRSLGNVREETRVLLNMAAVAERQARHEDALRLFQQSMERAQTTNMVDVQIGAAEGMGVVLTAKRDFSKALQALNQSLELARRVNARSREVQILWRTAETYYSMQNYRESAALAEQALTLARSLQLPKLTYLATTALGEAYAADNKNELAISTLKEAIKQIEEMRDRVAGWQEGRHLFFENKVGPYHTLVKLLTKQGKNFEALLYAERAKGRVLLEAVRNNRSDLQNLYTEPERIEAEHLINKLSAIRERIKSESDREAKSNLENELNVVQHELVLFQERLAVAHAELLLRAGPPRSLTPTSLNTLTPVNEFAYLQYVVTHENVGLFILKRNSGTTDHELKYINLLVNDAELRRKVNDFHVALAERHPGYDALGRELYQLLLAPAANELQNISAVCVVPDGFLWTLPFQALTTARGNYLIEEYSLSYAPSFSVLNEMALRRRQLNSKESLLAFGNPLSQRNEELKQDLHPLPEAEAEVAAIARAVRSQAKVLVGAQAEERTFKALAPQYATIHLATHGVLDNRDPLGSYLVLSRTDGDTEDDGLLKAREIINMRLDADLAVLSACETANGRLSPGEGVIGMSWAFFVAGARSVVVSQWRVNSASTSLLMKNFYQALARQNDANSRSKSDALREASLRVLKERRYRHPFYWAGFVLVSGN